MLTASNLTARDGLLPSALRSGDDGIASATDMLVGWRAAIQDKPRDVLVCNVPLHGLDVACWRSDRGQFQPHLNGRIFSGCYNAEDVPVAVLLDAIPSVNLARVSDRWQLPKLLAPGEREAVCNAVD